MVEGYPRVRVAEVADDVLHGDDFDVCVMSGVCRKDSTPVDGFVQQKLYLHS